MILIITHALLKLDEAIKGKIWCHYFDQLPPISGYDETVGAYKLGDTVPDSIEGTIKHTRLKYRRDKAYARWQKAEQRLKNLYEIEYKISYANVFQGMINISQDEPWEAPMIERGDPRPTALIDNFLAVPGVLVTSPWWGFLLLCKAVGATKEAILCKRGVKKEKDTIKIFEEVINASDVIQITRPDYETVVILKSKGTTYRISFDRVPVDSIENVPSFEYPITYVDKKGKSTPYKYVMNLTYDLLQSGGQEHFTDSADAKIATISSIGGFKHIWDQITQANLAGIARDVIRGI